MTTFLHRTSVYYKRVLLPDDDTYREAHYFEHKGMGEEFPQAVFKALNLDTPNEWADIFRPYNIDWWTWKTHQSTSMPQSPMEAYVATMQDRSMSVGDIIITQSYSVDDDGSLTYLSTAGVECENHGWTRLGTIMIAVITAFFRKEV